MLNLELSKAIDPSKAYIYDFSVSPELTHGDHLDKDQLLELLSCLEDAKAEIENILDKLTD